ncbi:MAG TPA: hypothetical protein VMI15_02725 [Burkholderiales bacterium]|nr:hypothetical protein [Burkholderiales bacterium]
MNIAIWIAAGGCIGWAAFAILGMNEYRGVVVSIVIGAVAGTVGGQVLAPMLSGSTALPGEFSFNALTIAALSAAACLVAGNVIHHRFGI